jgi:hypothetical protein
MAPPYLSRAESRPSNVAMDRVSDADANLLVDVTVHEVSG